MTKYDENRQQDAFVEHECAKFLDKYLWTKLNKHHERIPDDTTKNMRGIDVEVGPFKIDEKVKNKKRGEIAFDKYNNAPSVEIITTNNATHEKNIAGWFINSNSMTNAYAFINVMDYETNTTDVLVLKKLRVFFFLKKDLLNYIGYDVLDHIFDEAEDLKFNGTKNKNNKITKPLRISHYDEEKGKNQTLYLAYSFYLPEKPVNLVTPVDEVLKKLPTWGEWDVTPRSYKLIGAQTRGVPKIIMP